MNTTLEQACRDAGVDLTLSNDILRRLRQEDGKAGSLETEKCHFPPLDGDQIIDAKRSEEITLPLQVCERSLTENQLPIELSEFGSCSVSSGTCTFTKEGLRSLGRALLPYLAYGVLNGGSATSYIDSKKNSGYYPPLSQIIDKEFKELAALGAGRAKGLTPAYINPDGSPGYSFLELKFRFLLLLQLTSGYEIPFFQMTSLATDEDLKEAYERFTASPLLSELLAHTHRDSLKPLSAVQSLIATFTVPKDSEEREIFTLAYGKEGSVLALPGGHGQNFYVLKDIYNRLYEEGKRFAYLVNVDNIANTPSLEHLALTALTGCDGAFEFSYKSPIDIKGGVLVRTESGRLTCRDIGVGIGEDEVLRAEAEGTPILFNCATGLFNLSYLTQNLDRIIEELPLRLSTQNKDAGIYAQAEQVTWEIIDIMDKPLILAVDKPDRFLAAKLLSELIMTQRADSIAPELLKANEKYSDFCAMSLELQRGFFSMMRQEYAMEIIDGRWVPIPINRLL